MRLLSNQNHKVKAALTKLIVPSILLFSSSTYSKDIPKIAISQFISHEAVNSTYDGLIDELARNGYVDGRTVKIVHDNAAGNAGTNVAIAQKIKGINPDVAVALTTPSAQALMGIATPMVFSIVTDPIEAKLIKSMKKPGNNITGVTDMPPIEDQIKLIKQILPKAKLIAVPFCPGESNSVKQVELIQKHAKKNKLKVQLLPVYNSSQIKLSMAKAVDSHADAYLIPLDNILVGAMDLVVNFANELKLPVFASDNASVIKNQALANRGFNYYDIGVKTGKIVVRILKGEKAGDIPVSAPDAGDYYFNLRAAKLLKIKIPECLLKQAKQIIE